MKLRFSRKHLCIPYAAFLALFVIAPIIIMLYYAFTDRNGAFTVMNFGRIFSDVSTISAILTSVSVAIITTVICLLLGYPVAYILARSGLKRAPTLLILFITPMWINFVLRLNALKEFFSLINLLDKSPYLNTVIGMVYDFLPFMILPLYTTLIKMDNSLVEASQDLGANKVTTFINVILPLSMPGIISGITMVFMPTMTNYVISDILGRSQITILGKLIENHFMQNNWNMGAAISMFLLSAMFVFTWLTGGFKSDSEGVARGSGLW
ncbi:MAG: ABC transporter permease [Clostridia bacterium]|nr:ABC transporter permease [Clostridia bacterium]